MLILNYVIMMNIKIINLSFVIALCFLISCLNKKEYVIYSSYQTPKVWYSTIDAFKLIDYVNSSNFEKNKATQPEKKAALKQFVSTLNDDDNPILIIATVK